MACTGRQQSTSWITRRRRPYSTSSKCIGKSCTSSLFVLISNNFTWVAENCLRSNLYQNRSQQSLYHRVCCLCDADTVWQSGRRQRVHTSVNATCHMVLHLVVGIQCYRPWAIQVSHSLWGARITTYCPNSLPLKNAWLNANHRGSRTRTHWTF
jgi:hypothetical protein